MGPNDTLLENWHEMSRGHFVHCHRDAIMFLDHNVPEKQRGKYSVKSQQVGLQCKIKDVVWFKIQNTNITFLH
jgi:hypothetical protein